VYSRAPAKSNRVARRATPDAVSVVIAATEWRYLAQHERRGDGGEQSGAGPPHRRAAERAGSQGHSIVQQALTRGEWTDETRAQLEVLLSQMTPEDRDALLAQFAQAINFQQLKVTTTGLPL
jgi:hypothetical protein